MKKVLQERITKLIRFASTENRRLQQRACAEWIARELQTGITVPGVNIQVVTHNHVQSVIAIRGKWKQPDILLNGHFDVVNAPAEQFRPIKGGDRIYGRGAADMKGGVAALMTAFIEAVNTNPSLSIALLLTGDEEVGGANGAAWFAQAGWKPKLIINLDGGYAEELTYAEKGILRIRLTAHGKSALSSYRWQGDSAIEKLLNANTVLEKMFPHSRRATDDNNWFSTFSITEFTSKNDKFKTIPESATLVASIHFVEAIHTTALLKKIRKSLPREISVEPLISAERVWMPHNHQAIKRFQKIYAKHLGHTPKIRGENGSSDARFFTHLNIPIIITKPIGGNPEMDNEWVSVRSVETLTRTLVEYLLDKPKR